MVCHGLPYWGPLLLPIHHLVRIERPSIVVVLIRSLASWSEFLLLQFVRHPTRWTIGLRHMSELVLWPHRRHLVPFPIPLFIHQTRSPLSGFAPHSILQQLEVLPSMLHIFFRVRVLPDKCLLPFDPPLLTLKATDTGVVLRSFPSIRALLPSKVPLSCVQPKSIISWGITAWTKLGLSKSGSHSI